MNNTHPLSEARAAELWDARLDGSFWRELNSDQRENALTDMRSGWDAAMRAAYDAGEADPHHDPRPWQDCTREDIREGDLVEAQSGDRLLVGVAHRQAENGDWFTEDGWMLTDGDYWSLRRIPAPTPPAEEVELPTEFGAVITDVEVDFEETVRLDSMVWTGLRWTYKDYSTITKLILAFTLPDGTRAIRDGQYEDGAPRFIKETTQ